MIELNLLYPDTEVATHPAFIEDYYCYFDIDESLHCQCTDGRHIPNFESVFWSSVIKNRRARQLDARYVGNRYFIGPRINP